MTLAGTGRTIVGMVREEDVPFMAASIAYYTVASIVPLLLLALAVVSVVGGRELLIETLRSVLSESGSAVLNQILTSAGGHGVAGGVGFLFTLWGGSKVFRGLAVAFDALYTRTSDHSLFDRLKKSALALGTILFAFVFLAAVSVTLAFVELPLRYPTLVSNLGGVVVLTLAFLPIFYIMPPLDVSLGHALPGAVVAAVGWVLLEVGFLYYVGSVSNYPAYGLLGAVLLFVTFLYFASIVLLVGAVVNVVLDR